MIYTILGFLINILINFGVFIIDPLYISIGLLLSLPANLIYDHFINLYKITNQ
jgi:hypothetical protein